MKDITEELLGQIRGIGYDDASDKNFEYRTAGNMEGLQEKDKLKDLDSIDTKAIFSRYEKLSSEEVDTLVNSVKVKHAYKYGWNSYIDNK